MSESAPISAPVPSSRGAGWEEYVRKAAAGDESAFSSLYDESNSLVYGIALRILGNVADAEEATLDVYTQVWKHAATYHPSRGSVNAWLATLARCRSIDRFRSSKRFQKEENTDVAATMPSLESDPER